MSLSFRALGVSAPVVQVLADRNITAPFAIQNLVLTDALAGVDILAASPTGSGKTLAFGIPIVERTAGADGRPAALVLVPTRELASQVVEDIRPLAAVKGLRIAAVYGGTSLGPQAKRAQGAQILVATPGRLFDLIERRLISLAAVRVLVLDEADRMLDMGFRPQVDRILRGVPENRQTMLFSATLAGPVLELAREYTSNPSRFRAEAPIEARQGDVDHAFVPVTPEDKLAASSSSSTVGAASRSSSYGRSTAPTSSPASSQRSTTSARRSCTGTCRRTRVSGRWPSSSRAGSRRSSPPMSPPAGSMSTTSRA